MSLKKCWYPAANKLICLRIESRADCTSGEPRHDCVCWMCKYKEKYFEMCLTSCKISHVLFFQVVSPQSGQKVDSYVQLGCFSLSYCSDIRIKQNERHVQNPGRPRLIRFSVFYPIWAACSRRRTPEHAPGGDVGVGPCALVSPSPPPELLFRWSDNCWRSSLQCSAVPCNYLLPG